MAGLGRTVHAGSNLPTGGQVVGGSATIGQTSATQIQITSTTARSAISWNDFSIGSGYGVNVTQPTGGTQLEQVRGTNVSQIFGSLTSNGSIVIANPNGIWFGPSAQVDVAGLTASTAHATATDIQNFQNGGSLNLSQAGNANAAVVNQGNITISNAGLAAFVAPGVRNDGVIQARLGTVQLSSGTTATLDFYGDGLVSIAVTGQTLAQAIDPSTGKALGAAVTNTGTLNADGGTVLVTANVASGVVDQVINTSGVIQARSVSQQNGQIVLDGGSNGTVQVAGTVDASGTSAGQTGGSVQMLGQTVNVAGNTTIDASGDQGGGTIYVGGGPHGQGTAYTASTVTVSQGATIKANAIAQGNGGTVAIWSAQFTSFDGGIEAMGGAQGGNGGFVETSGAKLTVGGDATVNTSAPNGVTGTWLLDPKTVDVVDTGGSGTYSSGSWTFGSSPTGTDSINASAIDSASSNVVLQANTDITVSSAIAMTTNGVGLELDAGRSIKINANISTTDGAFTASINDGNALAADRAPGRASLSSGSHSIATDGGAIDISTGNFGGGGSANISSNAISVGNLNAGNGAVSVTTTFGNVTLNGVTAGSLTVDAAGVETLKTGTYTIGSGPYVLPTAVSVNGTLTLSQPWTFGAAVTLSGTTKISGAGDVAFDGTVDGNHALTVNSAGTTTFGGAVGGTVHLASVTTDTAGTIAIDGGSIATTGAQTYNDPVSLGADTTLTSTASGNVTFGGTVNGAHALTVSTGGTTTFDGAVGGSLEPTNLAVTSGGLALNAAISANAILLRTTAANGDITVKHPITASGTGDSLTVASGRNFDLAVAGTLSAPAGQWLVYVQDPANDLANSLSYAFKQYDAPYGTTPAQATGNGFLYSLAPVLTYGLTGVSKTYDGTTAATLSAGNFVLLTGLLSGDNAPAVTGPTTGTYDTKTVGTNDKTVTADASTAIAASTTDRSGHTVYGYRVTGPATTATATIVPAALTITADDKTKTVGSANPPLTVSYTGLAAGDAGAMVNGLSLTTTALTTSPAGSYPIILSGATATNYTIGYVDGVLTVTGTTIDPGVIGQVARQAQNPGMIAAFGNEPSLGGSLGVGGGIAPAAGEHDFLEGVYLFANAFLDGTEKLP